MSRRLDRRQEATSTPRRIVTGQTWLLLDDGSETRVGVGDAATGPLEFFDQVLDDTEISAVAAARR